MTGGHWKGESLIPKTPEGGKLDLEFRGPYTIADDLGKGRYKLKISCD